MSRYKTEEQKQKHRECQRRYRKKHHAHRLESNRKWRNKNKNRVTAYHLKYDRKYPKKYRARRLLNTALLKGEIIRPNLCSDCGKKKILHGHHEDYSKPLDVVWLCPACHKKIHRMKKK